MQSERAKRVATIKKWLRLEYQQAAANEIRVATLRYEMSSLPHRHHLLQLPTISGTRECQWCFYGTENYLRPLDDILAEIRAMECGDCGHIYSDRPTRNDTAHDAVCGL